MLLPGQIVQTLDKNIKLVRQHSATMWMGRYCTKNGVVKSNANLYLFKTEFLEQHAGQKINFSDSRKRLIMSLVFKYMSYLNEELGIDVEHSFTNKRSESGCYISQSKIEYGLDQLCAFYHKGYTDYTDLFIGGKTVDEYLWAGVAERKYSNAIAMVVAHEYAHALDMIWATNKNKFYFHRASHDIVWGEIVKEVFALLQDCK